MQDASGSQHEPRLPKLSPGDSLARRSLILLQHVLPEHRFLFRPEHAADVGVDGSLELLVAGHHTNQRAHLQLKATENPRRNSDGSISLSVNTSNLNYLLNGSCGLYVLAVFPEEDIRFVWASDVATDLDARNPEWRAQETVTMRFLREMDAHAFDAIEKRIHAASSIQRDVMVALARAGTDESCKLEINRTTLTITDPMAAEELVANAGLTAISSGFAKEIIDLIGLLSATARRRPRVSLVHAYANHARGRHGLALEQLREIVDRQGFTDSDWRFMQRLRSSCELAAGRISRRQYDEVLTELASQDPIVAVEQRLESALDAISASPSAEDREIAIRHASRVVDEIMNCEGCSDMLKLRARIELNTQEGYRAATAVQVATAHLGMQSAAPPAIRPHSTLEELEATSRAVARWEREATHLITEAERLRHPVLVADAHFSRIRVNLLSLGHQYLQAAVVHRDLTSFESDVNALIQYCQHVIERYEGAEILESELNARMTLAELYCFVQKEDAAREIAVGVLPVARAMNFAKAIKRAQALLDGQDLVSDVMKQAKAFRSDDQDPRIAALTDADVENFARTSLRLQSLPDDRLPHLVCAVSCDREIARQRLDHCRHIDMLEDLRHTQSLETYYREAAPRICTCQLHRYRSARADPDWETVLANFKSKHCVSCEKRTPKRKESV